jgi:hypothetical protein
VTFVATEEWLPETGAGINQYYSHLTLIKNAFDTTSIYLHFFSRAPEDVPPQRTFREYYDQANILIALVDTNTGYYGVNTVFLEEEGRKAGYIIRIYPQSLNSIFPIVRELGFITDDMLDSIPSNDFRTTLGGSQNPDEDFWIPGDGFVGNESLFPTATEGFREDFKDTFGRMFTGTLSLDVARPRYEFILANLNVWLAMLR